MRLRPWPLSVIPTKPPGMSDDEARLAGILPPVGWRAPARASVSDSVRTAAAAARLIPRLARAAIVPDAAPAGTTTEEGLGALRGICERLLDRLGVTVEVRGIHRVPRDGGLVLMWNQTSHLDHLVLPAAIPRPFHSLYNNELRRTPLYGRLLARGGHFWVDRTDETQWRASIDAAAARVREGACVLVSPEGTRSWDGRLLPMKRGAFLLARSSERPIVCVTVAGAHDRLPRGCAAVRPGKVRVTFSEPIAVSRDDESLERTVIETFERDLA
jgi:1-acyl-sn-glycerol-3-phosphate acyltransferase